MTRPYKKRRQMTVAQAEKLLGLTTGYDGAAVKAATAKALREAHPDHGGGADAADQIKLVKAARDVLLASADTGEFEYVTCSRCNGKGVRPDGAFGHKTCVACDGEGVVRRRAK